MINDDDRGKKARLGENNIIIIIDRVPGWTCNWR